MERGHSGLGTFFRQGRRLNASFVIAVSDNDDVSCIRTHHDTFSLDPYGRTKIGGKTIDKAKDMLPISITHIPQSGQVARLK